MTWQVYSDESEKDGLFVLAGYLASSDKWAAFSEEWQPLARRFGRVGADGRYSFHMTEQRSDAMLMEYLPAFYRVIENHVTSGFAIALRTSDFHAAMSRIEVKDVSGRRSKPEGAILSNPYAFCFSCFVEIQSKRAHLGTLENVAPGAKIEFIFDERSEKKKIIEDWHYSMEHNRYADRFGPPPIFKDDRDATPLQAADLIAWWVRSEVSKHSIEGTFESGGLMTAYPWREKRVMPFNISPLNQRLIIITAAKIILAQRPDLEVYESENLVARKKSAAR